MKKRNARRGAGMGGSLLELPNAGERRAERERYVTDAHRKFGGYGVRSQELLKAHEAWEVTDELERMYGVFVASASPENQEVARKIKNFLTNRRP